MYLKHLDIDTECITPLWHTDKQHGLTNEIIEQILPNSLVIIPDAGTNDVKQCKKLKEIGCEILICDHHQKEKDNPYATIINNQCSPNVTNKDGSGTLVTFKFIQYCCQQQNDKWYKRLIDIVAVANLGDVMDMRSLENRCFNYYGLKKIRNPFLNAMCDEFIKGDVITPKDIVWSIIPKVNAVQRSNNQELKQALFDCLVGDSDDYVDVISQLKKSHKQQGDNTKDLANDVEIEDWGKIIFATCPKTPYTGLYANKLCGAYNKPILLVHDDDGVYIGSCRSPFEIRDIFDESGLFNFCSGHECAFGVSINEQNISTLKEFIINSTIEPKPIQVCNSYQAKSIPKSLFGYFGEYLPLFGEGVKMPLFFIDNIHINGRDIVELGNNKTTIKFNYNNTEYIKFFVSKYEKKCLFVGENIDVQINVLGELSINSWNNKKTPQVIIDKYEVLLEESKKDTDWEEMF